MRQAVYRAPRDVRVAESGDPALGPCDVLLRVEACGICGSDVASYLHGHYASDGQVLGHEMSCIIVAAGREVDLAPGTRVAVCPARSCGTCPYCLHDEPGLCADSGAMTLGYGVPGGFADLIRYPQPVIGRDIFPVPAEVAADDLLWCEPLAVAVRAVRRAMVAAGGTVDHLVVLGAGSVGLCVAGAARALQVPAVTVVEPRELRRAAAGRLTDVAAAADMSEVGRSVSIVIDSSGSAAALASVPVHLPLVLVGLGDGPVPWPRANIHTSFAYSPSDMATAVDLVVSGRVRLGSHISHRFGLDEVSHAIEVSATDPTAIKVVIVP